MAELVIELDVSRPWSPEAAARPRRPPIMGALFLAAVVAGVLTGPALAAGRPFTFAWRAPTLGGFFWLTPRVLFTIDASPEVAGPAEVPAQRRLSFSARDLKTGLPLWTVELTGPLAESYGRENEVKVSPFPPTFNLGVTTTVIDTRTGRTVRAYPSSSAALVYIAGDVVVLIDRDPAGGPEPTLPPNSMETGLDRAHVVVARDLGTGKVRWTRRLAPGVRWDLPGVRPGTEGISGLPEGQDWMLTYTAAGDIGTWDLGTGELLGHRSVGPMSQLSYVAALPDAVLVRVKARDEASFAAYDPISLSPRWSSSPPDIYASPFGCGPRLCLETDRSVWAVDPGTGAFAWRIEGPRLRPAEFSARSLVTGFGEQLALFDPATGARLPGDGAWRVVDMAPYGSPVMLARAHTNGGAQLGMLDVATNTIRRLGQVTPFTPASQCAVVEGYVACEDGGVVRLWPTR